MLKVFLMCGIIYSFILAVCKQRSVCVVKYGDRKSKDTKDDCMVKMDEGRISF